MTLRDDPVGREFYLPLRNVEFWSDLVFYAAAGLSIAALLIEKSAMPILYEAVQLGFALSVIIVFVLGIVIRLYWSAAAQEKRCADFVSSAFGVPLLHGKSTGYYNNDQTDPFQRICASVLENSLFSKRIVRKMLVNERARVGIYIVIWMVAVFNRTTDLALITAVAQVLFSEQIISKWIRLEWLSRRFERAYETSYALIQSTSDFRSPEFKARTVQLLAMYEIGKAQGGVSLSTRVFDRINQSVSREWDDLKKSLGIL